MTNTTQALNIAQQFGCHCDLEPGMKPDGCVIDSGQRQDCVNAEKYERKEECHYWQPVSLAAFTAASAEAQPSQEPAAFVRPNEIEGLSDPRIAGRGCFLSKEKTEAHTLAIYTHPQPSAPVAQDDECKVIVKRIWEMLGSPSYEQLAGRSIYDLIAELQAKAVQAERHVLTDEYLRQFVQLQPCACPDEPDAHSVIFKVGVQSFVIGRVASENKEHADWYASMFVKALQNILSAAPQVEAKEGWLSYVDFECTEDQDKQLSIVSGFMAGKAYNEMCHMIGGRFPDCRIEEEAPTAHRFFMELFGAAAPSSQKEGEQPE